jgi:predicted phage-related endonuclease
MGEKVCRMMLEQEHGTLFKPKTWQSKDCEWHRCSDDGYSLDLEVLLEIKAMGAKPHEVMAEAAKTNDLSGIPEHYYPQCQWNLMVSGAKECWFISFRPEDNSMHRVVVTPDPAYWKKLRKAVDEFWLVNVKKDIPPALTDKDYKPISTPEYAALAEEYVRLKAEIKEREERLENLKAKLESFVGTHPAITGHGLKIRRYVREGAVDYSKVPALSGVDLGQYRKPGSVVTEIRLAAV